MTMWDNEGVAWTYNPTLNELGHPTITGNGMTIEITDPAIADTVALLFASEEIADAVGPTLEAAASAYSDPSCGRMGCNQYTRAFENAHRTAGLNMRWRVKGRDWEPREGWAPPPPEPWLPPRRPGPNFELEPEDVAAFSAPLVFQMGVSCSDVASAALIATNDYRGHKVSLRQVFYFSGIKAFARRVGDDILYNRLELLRDGAGAWKLFNPRSLAMMVLNGVGWWAYTERVSATQISFLTWMWNAQSCGSQTVTLGEVLFLGGLGSSGGTLFLVCFDQWVDIALASGTVQVWARVCQQSAS